MRLAHRRLIVTLAIALCTPAAGLVHQAAAWDSKSWNPTHPTHSYLTEWAVDQLKAEFPEVQTFRDQLIEGANSELHELKTSGELYGVNLEAKRIEHKGTNAGCDDIKGWWVDALDAYDLGDKKRAYSLLGVMLHMVEDMGVPAHANKVYHQGNPTEFDNFEFMALSNWKPSFDDINRTDPGFAEPWKYYGESQNWTHADAPDYHNRNKFSKTWAFASAKERALLSDRQGRTCNVTMWALRAGAKAFARAFTIEMTPRGVLLAGKWRTEDELNQMTSEDKRNTLIVELSKITNQTVGYFQGFDDHALVGKGATAVFLREAGIRDESALKKMTDDDQRNTLITWLGKQLNMGLELQAKSNKELVVMALRSIPKKG